MDEPASPNRQTPQDASSREINTQCGTFVERDVKVEGGGDFVGRDKITTIIQQAQAYKFETLHELRTIRDTFTGRADEIAQLIALARSERGGAAMTICSSVTGMGGVGKSELANLVAHALSADYPDAQVWLELGAHSIKPATPRQALERVLHTWLPGEKLPDELTALQGIYRQQLSGKRALVVLDDVANDDDLAVLLPPAGCLALATSRRALATGTVLRLDTLQPADSVALLRRFRPALSEANANALAELCGHLPVALTVAGSYLKQNVSVTAARYLAALSATPFETLRFGGDEKNDVARVFAHSANQLSEAERRAWCALSVMPADFDRAAGVAVSGVADDALSHPLDVLVALNLLDYDPQAERFSWHDLLQQFARNQMNGFVDIAATSRSVWKRHAEHYTRVAKLADGMYLEGQSLAGLMLFDRERKQIEVTFANLSMSTSSIADYAALIVELVNALVYVSNLRFHPSKRIMWFQTQAIAARAIGDRSGESAAIGNLGNTYDSLGESRKAIDFHEQALLIVREMGDRHHEGAILSNLGNAYRNLGESFKAIDFYEQALVVLGENGNRRGEGATLGNLGTAYRNLGEVHRAITFYEKWLGITREIGDRHGEGAALGSLGNAYINLGDVHRAFDLYGQWLVIAREVGDRHGEGTALGNLGLAYVNLGETRKAISFYEQFLVIAREIGDRRIEGNALGNLGNAYADLGEAHKTIDFFEQQLKIARMIGYRRGEGIALGNLGNAFIDLGEAHKAIDLYEQQLNIAREIGYRRSEGNALGSLGNAYRNIGEVHKAIDFYEQRLVIAQEIDDRRGVGNALGNLGNAYADLGESRKAIELYKQHMVIAHEIGDRRGKADVSWNLGLRYEAEGDLIRAIEFMQLCVDFEVKLGHPDAEGHVAHVAGLRTRLAQ